MRVLCVGCFDLLHSGHVRHLQEASRMGELWVGVTRDKFVGKPGRPIIPELERLELVSALKCVSWAFLCDNSLEALDKAIPDIFVKGSDYVKKGLLPSEMLYCTQNGVEMKFTKPNPQTSTKIIQRVSQSLEGWGM